MGHSRIRFSGHQISSFRYGWIEKGFAFAKVEETDLNLFSERLDARYSAIKTFTHLGQAHTTLEIFKRKDAE